MPNDQMTPYRVAIYFAPDSSSEWWTVGSHWLGRCAATNRVMQQPKISAVNPADFFRLTAEPRRYGWHATLKAPFQLAPGCNLDELRAAVIQFCRGRGPVHLPPLKVSLLGNFLALTPQQASPELELLAADCVQQLHAFAATLNDSELARRREAGLTPEQDALLVAWGYPWVMQHFRFHLSLTGPLTGEAARVVESLQEEAVTQFHHLPACKVDRLSIFVEPARGADFVLYDQIELQP